MRLIPAGNLTSADPVLPIRWCLERSETEELKQREAKNVGILFVIAYEGTTMEDRQLVPINQVMEYLNFRRPGKHTVFAKIVWPGYGGTWDFLRSSLLQRVNPSTYRNNLLDEDRRGWEKSFGHWNTVQSLGIEAELDIVIPSEHFPKEPPAWFKWLVNVGYENAAFDQCQFRKRMLAVPLKVPVMALWAVLTTLIRVICALGCLLFGMRHIGFGAIIHPWSHDISDVFASVTNSWFFTDSELEDRPKRFLLLHPLLWLALFGVLAFLKVHFHKTYLELTMIGLGAVWHVLIAIEKFMVTHLIFDLAIGVVALLVAAIARAIYKKGEAEKTSEYWKARRQKQQETRERRERERSQSYDSLYELLACRPNLIPDVSALPAERQTLHLRFLKIKAKVCRPWAIS